ncbi:MAG: hypothetical protein QNJ68_18435 [Microcoleaceae cyanobacterium MO_207.B10]|nr:hypothetical protein [Microcoleaceae cyanobacterium MO_207.B10]
MGETEQIIANIHQTLWFQQLIPMETSISWPIPLRQKGCVYVILPCIGVKTTTAGQTILFPPLATLTLDWSNQAIVEYVDLKFKNPWQQEATESQIGTFPHEAIANLTVDEYKQKRSELLAMYDKMFYWLATGSSFSEEWCSDFSQLLQLLIEPSLKPYYQDLQPKFFDRFIHN